VGFVGNLLLLPAVKELQSCTTLDPTCSVGSRVVQLCTDRRESLHDGRSVVWTQSLPVWWQYLQGSPNVRPKRERGQFLGL